MIRGLHGDLANSTIPTTKQEYARYLRRELSIRPSLRILQIFQVDNLLKVRMPSID